MKKFLSFILPIVVFLFFTTITTEAMTVSPNNGSFSPGAEQTIAVLADTPPDVHAVQLHLLVEGATIVPDSFDSAFALKIGTCIEDPEVFTTSRTVCVDMSRRSAIETGTLLGSFKIKFDSGVTSAVVKTNDGNGYLIGSEVSLDENRILGTYTISSQNTPAPTQLPVAGIEDYPGVVLGLGLLTVMLGVGFFIWRNKAQAVT